MEPSKTCLASNIENSLVIQGDNNFVNITAPPSTNNCKEKVVVTSLPGIEIPSKYFTGRQAYLNKLHSFMVIGDDETPKIVVITGLGGLGKSSAARKYAADFNKHYGQNVAWIQAETWESTMNSFIGLAQHFQIDPDQYKDPMKKESFQEDKLSRAVYQYFSDNVQKGLFIFDNAEQMRSDPVQFGIQNFLPPPPTLGSHHPHYPHILITSRNTSWGMVGDEIKTYELKSLDEDEVMDFFSQTLKCPANTPETPDSLSPLLKELGIQLLDGHALALNLAVAVISNELLRVQADDPRFQKRLEAQLKNYIGVFKKNGQKWLQSRPDNYRDKYDKIMENVWQGTMDRIKLFEDDSSRLAIDLLNILAFLPPETALVQFLHFFHRGVTLSDKIVEEFVTHHDDEDTPNEVEEALGLLQKYSMVSFVKPKICYTQRGWPIMELVSVHRLVQKWTHENLNLNSHSGTDYIRRLGQYLEDNWGNLFHFRELVQTLIQHLKELGKREWPLDTDRLYLSLSYRQFRGCNHPQLQMAAREVWQFRKGRQNHGHERLVKIVLVMLKHFGNQNFFEDTKIFEFELDNGDWFEETDYFFKITVDKFIEFMLTHAKENIGDTFLQRIVLGVLWPFRNFQPVAGSKSYDRVRVAVEDWFEEFHRGLLAGNIFWTMDMSHVFMVVKNFVPDSAYYKTLVRVFTLIHEGRSTYDPDYCWTYFLTANIKWQLYDWEEPVADNRIDAYGQAREKDKITSFFDAGGIHVLTMGLNWIASIPQTDAPLNDFPYKLGVNRILGTIQIAAATDTCRNKMLSTPAFMDSLKNIFASVANAFHTNPHYRNSLNMMGIILEIVLSWFALLTSSETVRDQTILESLYVDMEKFDSSFMKICKSDMEALLLDFLCHHFRGKQIVTSFLKIHDVPSSTCPTLFVKVAKELLQPVR